MKHFLLFYDVSADYLERRATFRAEHLGKAWAASARGELVLGGALNPSTEGAVLLFRCADATTVEEFAKTDPYVLNGLVTSWRVREWMTVAGEQASNPVKL